MLTRGITSVSFMVKKMRSEKHGHIFNICSVASKAPVKNGGSYSVTKAAMLSLNHVLRQELAPHNVKVTAFLPVQPKLHPGKEQQFPMKNLYSPKILQKLCLPFLNLSKGVNIDEVLITPLDF
ncbi:SDR family NAD(P)-dependent oxidoreductase [Pedobacter fastidiosus]|uniref:SDR family NAD(P)-dependent oxidoreductase n=1 Tax=Pedobacter fastidiosus TaxID=2765361 RepID=UPI00360BC054